MTDEEREEFIKHCARCIERAMARYANTHIPAARCDAEYWKDRMNEAINERSPAMVARLEQQKGLNHVD